MEINKDDIVAIKDTALNDDDEITTVEYIMHKYMLDEAGAWDAAKKIWRCDGSLTERLNR